MLTDIDQRVIEQIVSVFETGTSKPNYAAIAILADGAGVSYGAHQATDASGSLDRIVRRYIDLCGPRARDLEPYVDYLLRNGTVKDGNSPATRRLVKILQEAAHDPAMVEAQRTVFRESYWEPALGDARAMGLLDPLSMLVLYDTHIHSGAARIPKLRRRFCELPPSLGGEERAWTEAFIAARHEWLSNFANPVVRKTTYRTLALSSLADQERWDLKPPFKLRGQDIK